MLELVLLDGTGRRFLLTEGCELTVGAAAHSAVRLTAADVSRQHSMISCVRGRVVALDLGSTNGTFVNGRRVKESELKAGDVIRFSSVLAQVVPPSTPPGGHFERVGGAGEPESPAAERSPRTSDLVPVILQESLISLLARWGASDSDAMGAFAEWLVATRGLRAAVILETVGSEVGVLAAHGDVSGLLEASGCLEAVRAGKPGAGTLETVEVEVGEHHAYVVRSAEVPCLMIVPNVAMPDCEEFELFMRLLSVAVRLDGQGVAKRLL
jgi:hypothetical protein